MRQSMKKFDLLVIGAGPGGYTGAIRAAQLGLSVAVAEKRDSLGGVCLNIGCIPSKALLESSEHYHFFKTEALQHGIRAKIQAPDVSLMMQRKQKIVSSLAEGIDFLFKKNKITRFKGFARLLSAEKAELISEGGKNREILHAKNILLACGSAPLDLPFVQRDGELIVSSTEALSLKRPPDNLIVIGAGSVGLELGSVWNRLGSKVTVIERAPFICGSMDGMIRDGLLKSLKKQGMTFHLSSQVTAVERAKSAAFAEVSFKDSTGAVCKRKGDKVLVCAGRKPCTEGLGLESAGASLNSEGRVLTDAFFRVNGKNVYAIGDLICGPMLAHKAEEEGVAVAEIIAKGFGCVNYNTVPFIIYTAPEAASVGKTEQDLKTEGRSFRAGVFPFAANGRARTMGQQEGAVKILADKETDQILGVHIFGPRAGDLIAEAAAVMEFSGKAEDLARSFHAHPTLSEAVREAALAVSGRARQM